MLLLFTKEVKLKTMTNINFLPLNYCFILGNFGSFLYFLKHIKNFWHSPSWTRNSARSGLTSVCHFSGMLATHAL